MILKVQLHGQPTMFCTPASPAPPASLTSTKTWSATRRSACCSPCLALVKLHGNAMDVRSAFRIAVCFSSSVTHTCKQEASSSISRNNIEPKAKAEVTRLDTDQVSNALPHICTCICPRGFDIGQTIEQIDYNKNVESCEGDRLYVNRAAR